MAVLTEHLDRVRKTLLSKAKEIGIAEHGTVSGSSRELILTEFFSKNLPRGFDYVTGEIIAPDDQRSGQIDILVLPHTAPRIVLSEPYCLGLVDAVASVIEVKSTLTTADIDSSSDLRNALNGITRVRSLQMSKLQPWPWQATMDDSHQVALPHIPAFVIAYYGPTKETLLRHLADWGRRNGIESLPNIVTCLDRDYTIIRNDGWMFVKKRLDPEYRDCLYLSNPISRTCLADLFDYLMKCLQAWTYSQPRTPLKGYVT